MFNLANYKQPEIREVDMNKTKENVGIFLSAYQSSRMKIGQPREPKVTASYSLAPSSKTNQVNSSTENTVIANIEAEEEFENLHKMFCSAYASINHPFKPEMTERRRKVFMMRYIYGLSVRSVSERINYQDNVVMDESKESIIQFAKALDILEIKGGDC